MGNSRRTIVHVIDEVAIGGAQTHLLTMIKSLKEHYDFDHQVVSLFGDGILASRFEDLEAPVQRLNLEDKLRKRHFLSIISKIKESLSEFDSPVVECHLTLDRWVPAPPC